MSDAELTRAILAELRKVAPEADPATLGPDEPLREALDIDSFDFLNVLIGLHKALGVEVPEADYGQLNTLDGMVRYFRHRV
jgi:acyl carrier protein